MMKWAMIIALLACSTAAHAQTRLAATAAQPDARVTITAPAAGFRVTGWDRGEVAVFGDDDAAGSATLKGTPSQIEVVLRGAVSVEVRLPRNTQVRIDGGNGNVIVAGLSGTIEAETVRGSLHIEGTLRSIDAYALAGAVEITGGGTEITRVETVGSDLTITKPNGLLDLKSGSGTILVRGSVRNAQVLNVSGRTRFEGVVAERGRLSLESLSGIIEVVVPRTLSAEYELSSLSGKVESAFGRTPRRNDGAPDEVLLTVGDGAARIRAFNLSGNVRLIAQD